STAADFLEGFPLSTRFGQVAQGILHLLARGQRNAESAALGPRVLENKLALMQLGNRPCNSKTKTCSAQSIRSHARLVSTEESFKDPGLKFIRNAATCVADRNLVVGVDLLEPYFDGSAFRCEFDGIVE